MANVGLVLHLITRGTLGLGTRGMLVEGHEAKTIYNISSRQRQTSQTLRAPSDIPPARASSLIHRLPLNLSGFTSFGLLLTARGVTHFSSCSQTVHFHSVSDCGSGLFFSRRATSACTAMCRRCTAASCAETRRSLRGLSREIEWA
jgi:hypothetical protein